MTGRRFLGVTGAAAVVVADLSAVDFEGPAAAGDFLGVHAEGSAANDWGEADDFDFLCPFPIVLGDGGGRDIEIAGGEMW